MCNLASLDLRGVETTQRARAWSRTARDLFPGLSVHELQVNPAAGSMQGRPFGQGSLWSILSPPVQVNYTPRHDESAQTFSVMLQLHGSTAARQDRHSCRLHTGEICMIDGVVPFELQVHEMYSQVMFMRLPRQMVLARYPYLERRTAIVLDPGDAGVVMLSDVLLRLLESAPFLTDDQSATTLVAVAQLLGVPKPSRSSELEEVSWRARAALAFIDANLADSTLDANRVAREQGVSRRWLDEILLRTVGVPLSAQIWLRRLQQAASDLQDPAHASKTVTQIAFSVGFEDAAHFTRTFKRNYHCTPREWRRAHTRTGASVKAALKAP